MLVDAIPRHTTYTNKNTRLNHSTVSICVKCEKKKRDTVNHCNNKTNCFQSIRYNTCNLIDAKTKKSTELDPLILLDIERHCTIHLICTTDEKVCIGEENNCYTTNLLSTTLSLNNRGVNKYSDDKGRIK